MTSLTSWHVRKLQQHLHRLPGKCSTPLYYCWSKEILEAGKKRLTGDTAREATSDAVKNLRREAGQLKEALAKLMMESRLLKKSVLGDW